MYRTFTTTSRMPGYLILPRALLKLGLTATELSVYMLLLDRARLSSQHPDWQDAAGNVFLLYPVRELAIALGSSETAVKNAMRGLEKKGLIIRQRLGMYRPNRIYVKLPEDDFPDVSEPVSPVGNEAAPHVGNEPVPHVGNEPVPHVGNEPAPPVGNEAAPPVGNEPVRHRARKLPPNKNYRNKTTELKQGSKHVFGILHNLTLTDKEAQELSLLPEGEAHAHKVALYLAGGWEFPDPMAAIRALARGMPMEDLLLHWPYTKQSPGPSPGPPPSYP